MIRKFILLWLFVPMLAFAAPKEDAIDLFAKLTEKTVLMPAMLPFVPGSILTDLPEDKTNAIAKIESEFLKRGVAVIHDGPHFVVVFPEGSRNFVTNSLSFTGAKLAAKKSAEMVPPGTVNFYNVDAGMVLSIYAAMSKRTVLRSIAIPGVVRLKTTCPLSEEEVLYALTEVLAINGVAVIKDGEKFALAVPMVQRSMFTTNAPKPDPATELFDPNKITSTNNNDPQPVSKLERDLIRWRKAFYEFIQYKPPPDRSAQRLLKLYASLADKTAELSDKFDGTPIYFHMTTPLTRMELMYAIEKTFDLYWLKIVEAADQKIRLERLQDRGPGTVR